jgi:hypothetical protein
MTSTISLFKFGTGRLVSLFPSSNSETTVAIFPISMSCMIGQLPRLVDHKSHMSCRFLLQACHGREMRGCHLQNFVLEAAAPEPDETPTLVRVRHYSALLHLLDQTF